MDDLFVLTSSSDEHSLYHQFTAALENRWNVEDKGPIHDLLNVEISREKDKVVLRQSGYIDKLLATYAPEGIPDSFTLNMTPAAPELSDAEAKVMLERPSPDETLHRRYQSLVGALLYASGNTRPDIALAVGLLCRAMYCPTTELYEAAMRVLHYLGRLRDLELHFQPSSEPLSGMSDSDWATRHSTSGYIFQYSQAAIAWSSKKQPCVALSSCEAEIIAASGAAKEATYLRMLLSDLGLGESEPTPLSTDNQAGRDLAYNPEHHARTKHIDRRHFFVREKVEDLTLVVPFVCTADNLADFFTRPLGPKAFFLMPDKIMNLPT